MAVSSLSRPQASLPSAPVPAEAPAEVQVRQGSPAEPAGTQGDRWAVLLWMSCGVLLAALLVKDLVGAILRAVFGG